MDAKRDWGFAGDYISRVPRSRTWFAYRSEERGDTRGTSSHPAA